MNNPMISVIMPNLNGKKRLVQAINSVLAQRYTNFELIVIDGRSTDGSHEILARLASEDTRLRWVQEEDTGLSDAINQGVKKASGDIIAYLGSDDEYLPGIFDHVAWMAERIAFDALLFSSYTYFVKEKKCVLQTPSTREITSETLLEFGTIVGLQNIFYRSSVFSVHSFDISLQFAMDYQLLWDLVLDDTSRMFVFSDRIASINYFEGNISHNNPDQAYEAMMIAQARMGTYTGPVWFQSLLPPPPPPPPSPISFKKRLLCRLGELIRILGRRL